MTKIRAEISEKNRYFIDKHRYYELKHFCLQYPTWQKAYQAVDVLCRGDSDMASYIKSNLGNNVTEKYAMQLAYYSNRIQMVDDAAKETDIMLAPYLLEAVTKDRSYTYLRMNTDIPCSRDIYYEAYRKFFWILSKVRE